MSSKQIAPGVGPEFATIAAKLFRLSFRNWRTAAHSMLIIVGFLRNYTTVLWRRLRNPSTDTLGIALIEHMGDLVAAEPISRFARAQFVGEISWVARRPYREIAGSYPSVQRVIAVTCMTEWLLLWSSRCFTACWDLHISEKVCSICGIGFAKPYPKGDVTEKTYYDFGSLLTVNCLSAGIRPIAGGPVILPKSEAVIRVDRLKLPQRFVVIHCRSNEDCRNWMLEKWRTLIRWIADELSLMVVEIGSEPYVIQSDYALGRSLCGAFGIMETAEIIKRSALFIGIDSGPAHLANAVGTPGLILLGAYRSFESYNPYSGGYADGSNADLIRSDGLAEGIPVEVVTSIVAKRLNRPKRPNRL